MTSPFTIECHTHEHVYPIHDYVTSVQWSEGVSAPWDSISIELSIPLGQIARIRDRDSDNTEFVGPEQVDDKGPKDIDPGAWIKIMDAGTDNVRAFGRIDNRDINLGASGGGSIATRSSIRTIGAFQFIRTLATEFIPTLAESIGGLLSMDDQKKYFEVVQELLKKPTLDQVVGANGLFRYLAPVSIPSTLFHGVNSLAGLFEVAYNPDTGLKNAPNRTMDEVPVSSFTALAHIFPSGTVLDMVIAMFQREPRLIELFPSMETPAIVAPAKEAGPARAVLIHRLCPWKTGDLNEMIVDTAGNQKGGKLWGDQTKKTWDITKAMNIDASHGYSIASTRTEGARVNAVTVNWSIAGGEPARLLPLAGVPIVGQDDVEKNGAKLMELSWDLGTLGEEGRAPLVGVQPPTMVTGFESPLIMMIRTVALLGWHFYGHGNVFEVGTINGPYVGTRARAGEIVTLSYGESGKRFVAYMTRVTHSFRVGARGAITANTSIQFDRGLWNEDSRNPHIYQSAVKPAAPPAPKQAAPTPPAARVVCNEGAPFATPWPTTLPSGIITAKTAGLRSWAKSRGLIIPQDVIGSVTEEYLMITAASAYVIERYWQTIVLSSQIKIINAYRPREDSRNHREGHAIDFSISITPGSVEKVTVLQTWASLRRLSDANRIPPGGRGLYLNASSTGLTGTLPDEAGQASGNERHPEVPNKALPRGASSGVHYDHRGAFGFVALPEGPVGKYVWLDTNGDGKDEYKTGVAGSSDAFDYLLGNLQPVAAYYLNEGLSDTSLSAVNNTVPNIMQVLGLEPSCFTT